MPKKVTLEEFKEAEKGCAAIDKLKNHMMEFVSDIEAPPVVEFVSICMDFHPSTPRPDGQIPFDL